MLTVDVGDGQHHRDVPHLVRSQPNQKHSAILLHQAYIHCCLAATSVSQHHLMQYHSMQQEPARQERTVKLATKLGLSDWMPHAFHLTCQSRHLQACKYSQ